VTVTGVPAARTATATQGGGPAVVAGSLATAARTGTEDLQGVTDVDEAMFLRHPLRPPLHGWTLTSTVALQDRQTRW
jgi:hypothetical protein